MAASPRSCPRPPIIRAGAARRSTGSSSISPSAGANGLPRQPFRPRGSQFQRALHGRPEWRHHPVRAASRTPPGTPGAPTAAASASSMSRSRRAARPTARRTIPTPRPREAEYRELGGPGRPSLPEIRPDPGPDDDHRPSRGRHRDHPHSPAPTAPGIGIAYMALVTGAHAVLAAGGAVVDAIKAVGGAVGRAIKAIARRDRPRARP